jgi:hypothetical protein
MSVFSGSLQALLATLHPANRRSHEHYGPCPFCGGDPRRSDRFRVWLEPGNERFWCRACNERGPLNKLFDDKQPRLHTIARQRPRSRKRAEAAPAHQEQYREIYTAVALWASANLHDSANPDALAYLQRRGLAPTTIREHLLGVTRRDPQALVEHLRDDHPTLLPYAETAGVLITNPDGELQTHPNLCGCLVFPYLANSEVTDLRTRSFPGKGYRSLAGGYESRGAIFPFGWNMLDDTTDTVILTEGEIKALAANQAYTAGKLSAPALAHPGLSYLRPEWSQQLRAHGITTVILAYDSQPRSMRDGHPTLAPEESWSLRHGAALAAAGLHVRVLRLPLRPGETKIDLDEFLLTHGTTRLQHLIDTAPDLATYQRSLPRNLIKEAKLRLPNPYPTRRKRPQRLTDHNIPKQEQSTTIDLTTARTQIATLAQNHAANGKGILVLAHPPGTGKGHNTALGLKNYLQSHPNPGYVVWTGLRKDQIHDQQTLPLIPLHGRNSNNCQKFSEAQILTGRGYNVHSSLCQRRCPYVDHCTYLRQFHQEGDLFASQPLLQATGWWKEAGIIVLDEFDPSQLTRIVDLNSANLAAIAREHNDPAALTVLRWIATLLSDCLDRSLTGALLLQELIKIAQRETLDFAHTLKKALATLPPDDEINQLRNLPNGATLADYHALPPNYLHILLRQLERELLRYTSGQQYTSRLEINQGILKLFLRLEHLITQLSRPDQPKLILDATANPTLIQSIFPNTPLQVERPTIAGAAHIRQIINRDWAKTTLRSTRRNDWYNAVASHIRPERPTLVVCTLACANDLRAALAARGHHNIIVTHYGALRGSNQYKGYDVILAQVYHPNLDAIIHEGRALFADNHDPLDERLITTERTLTDTCGESWVVQVPTFADHRLAALLEQRREAEMAQAALRGRPFEHPEAQITLLFGLPLPQLPPTEVQSDMLSPKSNAARFDEAREKVLEAAKALFAANKHVIDVEDIENITQQSVPTIRKHMAAVASHLKVRLVKRKRWVKLPNGGHRTYDRSVLIQQNHQTPAQEQPSSLETTATIDIDHAHNTDHVTRVIYVKKLLCSHRFCHGIIPKFGRVPRKSRLRGKYRLTKSPDQVEET